MKTYPIVIAAFVLGVILTVFCYQALTIYQLRSTVADDHAAITQVVGFLNSQIQAANGGRASAADSSGASFSQPAAKK